MLPLKILIIATSHGDLGNTGRKTGLWLEELVSPYYIFREEGAVVTIASPDGGAIPLDPKSESIIVANSYTKRYMKDSEAIAALAHPIALSTLNAMDFDLVYLTGGHGAMWDFADNTPLKQLLEDFNRQHKLIAAVCHGVAALLPLQNSQGELLIKGRQLTGFSDREEESSGLTTVVPYLLEAKLVQLGAVYSKAANYISYTVTDGNIITGQNPGSSVEMARKIISYMKLNTVRVEKPVLN